MSTSSREMDSAVENGKSAVGKAGQAVASAVEEVGHKASEAAGKMKDAGTRAAGYVRDQYAHLNEEAHEAYAHARDKARNWEHAAESYVQQRPIKSLLIAAGIGALLALLWRRHD